MEAGGQEAGGPEAGVLGAGGLEAWGLEAGGLEAGELEAGGLEAGAWRWAPASESRGNHWQRSSGGLWGTGGRRVPLPGPGGPSS